MKTCSRCKFEKPKNEFYRHKNRRDGLKCQCKACCKEYKQSKRGKIANIKSARKYRSTINGYLRECFSHLSGRCRNKNLSNYKYYGKRGIENRFESVEQFIDYVTNTLQIDPRGLQIDRIDNNGHYEPGNIRFVTAKVNCNNRRN